MARAKTISGEEGFRHDEIDACLATGSSDFVELFTIARSVNEFRGNDKFKDMLLGFKRMNNILSGFRKKNTGYALTFNQKLLERARTAFERAQRDNRSKRAASQWIAYVDSEIKRREVMGQEAPEYKPREQDDLIDALPQG